MHGIPILRDFVIIIGSAIVVLLIANRFRIPAVVGLLLTGVLIGPSALGLVRELEQVRLLAEIGVVTLLFTIGLEFSLDRLKHIRRPLIVGGSLQSLLSGAIVVGAALLAGYSFPRALFFSFLAILSSTAIVLKLYADRKELETPHGKLVIGILLFQDFLVVVMIVIAPVLAGRVAASPQAILLRFGGGLLIIAAVVLVARLVIPRLLGQLVRTRSTEVLVLAAIFSGVGMALVTDRLRFSMALGAFLAGIIIAESEYSHQVIADVLPFRDVFASLFFISIGMLLDLRYVAEHPGAVAGLGLGIVIIKFTVVWATVRLMGYPGRTAGLTGLAVAQVGEFSFVLATAGRGLGLLTGVEYAAFIGASIVTMLITPFLIGGGNQLVSILSRRLNEAPTDDTGKPALQGHVVVVGFGLNGRNLARVLREVGIRYTVIELDGENVKRAAKAGEPIIYGDATRREILRLAGTETAHTVVFGISDLAAVRNAVRMARELNPNVRIIVRTRQVSEIDDLYSRGSDDVIAEEFETSIEVFTRVLEGYHVPANVIEAQIRVLRGDRYQLLRTAAGAGRVSDEVLDLLAAGTAAILRVRDSWVVGKTMEELRLREETGATIIAIVRNQDAFTSPAADFVLEKGDFAVIVGNHAAVDAAFRYFEQKDGGTPAQ
jgi:CPA2 family monovalent cation:H+ antiporter-2